jgi:uncharacterized protein
MNEPELKRLAGRFGIPVGTLEKDYAITILLLVISRFTKVSNMVFKGGTAIKKIYFEETRFSEDLDFTCTEDISDELVQKIETEFRKGLDVNFKEVKPDNVFDNSKKYLVKYNDFNEYPNSVRIDLSLREKPINPVTSRKVLHHYELGNKDFAIPTMDLEEIMGEKVRAIIYAGQPRHLYDSWFLLSKKNVRILPNVVRQKVNLYKDDFKEDKFKESVNNMERQWIADLQPFLPKVPPFKDVSAVVTEKILTAMRSK